MLSRMQSKLGTAGLVVAIVALVAALTGAAYAANAALSSKQKSEVTKIAKKYAGKPGAPGAPGLAGAPGAKGDKGDKGDSGTNGTNGKSVVVNSEAPGANCTDGGVNVAVEGSTKKFVCNGQSGFTETLPKGETETGVWSAINATGALPSTLLSFSFNIPLEDGASYEANWINAAGEAKVGSLENCPGSASAPEAKAGNLCVYTTGSEKVPAPENMTFFTKEEVGAVAVFNLESGGSALGTWAVTAPTS